jgi:ribosomal protein L11 methyltransferase
MIDWEMQWELHAPNFSEGRLQLPLAPYGVEGTLDLHPGPGFGDFSHPTTKLTAQMMAALVKNKTVVDIGCGSGILTLLALKLGASKALGIDCDPLSVEHARENAKRSGQKAHFYLPDRAPLPNNSCLLMNMIASQQQEALTQYAPLFKNPLYIVTSGILEEDQDYLAKTEHWGWKLLKKESLDGWMGFVFINPSPKKVTICASEAKPKQRGEAPVCTRNTIAKGKGDEED